MVLHLTGNKIDKLSLGADDRHCPGASRTNYSFLATGRDI